MHDRRGLHRRLRRLGSAWAHPEPGVPFADGTVPSLRLDGDQIDAGGMVPGDREDHVLVTVALPATAGNELPGTSTDLSIRIAAA